MNLTRDRIVVPAGMALYVTGIAFAAAVAAEPIRCDRQRAAVLHRHDEAVRQWHEFRMAAERRAEAAPAAGTLAPVVR